MSYLARLLRGRREQLGMTLRQMEERVGLSNPYLCQLERGQVRNPTVLKALALADGYEIPLGELVDAVARDAGWSPGAAGIDSFRR
jgi:transcriptional regulator with XRE-family HTH domain